MRAWLQHPAEWAEQASWLWETPAGVNLGVELVQQGSLGMARCNTRHQDNMPQKKGCFTEKYSCTSFRPHINWPGLELP